LIQLISEQPLLRISICRTDLQAPNRSLYLKHSAKWEVLTEKRARKTLVAPKLVNLMTNTTLAAYPQTTRLRTHDNTTSSRNSGTSCDVLATTASSSAITNCLSVYQWHEEHEAHLKNTAAEGCRDNITPSPHQTCDNTSVSC